ncbi:flagellar hook-associated protein FlgK [Alkalilimnicola ehrlichii]|uniref:Flagellar hook-associated protein 1 n=1 Tax=Alkalilimnicola ehrlichii TaxID=351052 RepID=A0A3E0X1K2_9GAMM|nr:flagellar hook-associated protein FlgK [Alkalilimnicola ehrlichii]RFA30733.1 flagellar hook-associated protein FlgK [Alkalilimnicola ehrlichii]RFA38309.1 flagellar hook-associated protein FlgK [Alkalilimnicola ehrlichii]
MTVLSQIGYSGLQAAHTALTVAGQNIANVNTPGFNRLALDTHSVAGHGRLSGGGGVEVTGIRRIVNDFNNQQLWRATTDAKYHETRQTYLTALESLVDSDGSSISIGLDNLFAALSEATTAPDSIALRQQILNDAEELTQRFNGLNGNIQSQINAVHGQRQSMVNEINGISNNIAELNDRIIQLEASGRDTASLRDHRDALIKDLSELVDIRPLERADGAIDVALANGQPLVSGRRASEIEVVQTGAGEQQLVLSFAGTDFALNQQRLGGSLGALYDVEYGSLRPAQDELHDMAGAIAELFNDTITQGFDLEGNAGQELFVYNPASTTGMLTLNPLRPEELALSSEPDEVGNSDILSQLIEIRHATIEVAGSNVPVNDAYAGLVGRVASTSRQNQADLEAAKSVQNSAQAQRDQVSAVNLDEEAINLMTYTQAYQANMRVISTSNELFASLLTMF